MTIRSNTHTYAGSARSVFQTATTGSFMNRGPQVCFDVDDDAAIAAAAAVTAAAEAAAATQAVADAEAAAALAAKNKPTDEEARLLKDVMRNKLAAKDAQTALEAANARLKDFDGIDPAKVRALLAAEATKEITDAEKRGEYDRIIKQVREDHASTVATKDAENLAFKEQLAAAQRQVDDLVVGSKFAASRFVSEETVLSGDKARRLYGDHFETENGVSVAYDKPRGSSDRTPLIDASTGEKLSFDAALEKIIRADPDFERIGKSKLKPGAGSTGSNTDKANTDTKKPVLSGRDLIAANLSKLRQGVV